MKIDLHVHTAPKSQCSNIDPMQLIEEAKKINLDGFCLTEHQVLWDIDEVADLAKEKKIKIFRGNEITTAQGDVLVFGLYENITGIITIKKLHEKVKNAGGFSILAHPFRGFKMFGTAELKMTVEQACKKKAFSYIDAIEIKNGKVSEKDNNLAAKAAKHLGLIGTAGSDAHNIDDLGKWVVDFEKEINNEQELIKELRIGRFTIETLR